MSDYEDFLKKRRKLWADNNRAAMAPVVAKPAAPVVAKPAARALPVVIPGGAMSPGALRKPSESVLPPSLPTAVKTPAAVAAQLNKYVKPVGPGIAAYKKKLQFEELKRSSQASEKSAPLPTFIPGKKLTASRAASLGATPAEITTALAAEQSGWKKLLDKTEESALARFGVGAARMALPGDTDAYFDNVGMTPERREMLDSSAAHGAGQFAGIAAGFMPYGAGGAAGAAKLISAVPKLAKAGRLAKGVVRAGAESVAALPQNLDIAINKDHATSPADIARNVGLNTALDFGMGAAFEGVGAAVRAYRSGAAARAASGAGEAAGKDAKAAGVSSAGDAYRNARSVEYGDWRDNLAQARTARMAKGESTVAGNLRAGAAPGVDPDLPNDIQLRDAEYMNERFNKELGMYANAKESHIFNLGMPSEVLTKTGFPDRPIELSSSVLKTKTVSHGYTPGKLRNLVRLLQEPVAVFKYGDGTDARNVVVELKIGDRDMLAGIRFSPKDGEITSVRTLFDKDTHKWLNWINQDKLLYADTEKLRSLINQQQTNFADVKYLDLEPINRLLQENGSVKHYFSPELQAGPKVSTGSPAAPARRPGIVNDAPQSVNGMSENVSDIPQNVSDVPKNADPGIMASAAESAVRDAPANPSFVEATSRSVDLSDPSLNYAPHTAASVKEYIRDIFGVEASAGGAASGVNGAVDDIIKLYPKKLDADAATAAYNRLFAAAADAPLIKNPDKMQQGFMEDVRGVGIKITDDLRQNIPDFKNYR